jgi:hypothetical protein|nr:MAG TPA: hypothetical protein [Caudoviricetes sp.]
MAIKYSVDKHTVCKLGGLLAQKYGEYNVSLKITEDTDNGRIVKVGKMDSLDLYTTEVATTIGAYIFDQAADGTWLVVVTSVPDDLTALIYQKPLINEESPRKLTSIANFYNDPEDGAVRGYILHALDRFYLSDDGFSGTPKKGATIEAIENGKLKITA